ncbi:MAG: TrkA family potassium uptake protein [Dehalococcoidia bacterium]|nr:TrkA family potassium uptake protein [Dehalococcoidia bacterium]
MNVVIMGCGRVGAAVAGRLGAEGHRVTILDTDAYAFHRLPSNFGGRGLVGSGTDNTMLEAAGIREADAFIALATGDNRNILAAQKAKHVYGVAIAVSRVKDPLRSELFGRLGIRTFSPTRIGADLAHDVLFSGE